MVVVSQLEAAQLGFMRWILEETNSASETMV